MVINLKIISCYVTLFWVTVDQEEIRNLLTALYYSKLYYGSEIWHLPGLTLKLKKRINLASANACKTCIPRENSHLLTHTEIHNLAKRALPENVCIYRHAIILYKLMRNELCDNELMWLNFQIVDNARSLTWSFITRQTYDVGKNILLNRMHILNNEIEKNWINMSLNTYKVKCMYVCMYLDLLSVSTFLK